MIWILRSALSVSAPSDPHPLILILPKHDANVYCGKTCLKGGAGRGRGFCGGLNPTF